MRDQAHNPPLCTYARIYTLDQAPPADMSEYWQDPSSHFLAQGGWPCLGRGLAVRLRGVPLAAPPAASWRGRGTQEFLARGARAHPTCRAPSR